MTRTIFPSPTARRHADVLPDPSDRVAESELHRLVSLHVERADTAGAACASLGPAQARAVAAAAGFPAVAEPLPAASSAPDGFLVHPLAGGPRPVILLEVSHAQPFPDGSALSGLRSRLRQGPGHAGSVLVLADAAHSFHLWDWSDEARAGLRVRRERLLRPGGPERDLVARLRDLREAPPPPPRDPDLEHPIGRAVLLRLPRRVRQREGLAPETGDPVGALVRALADTRSPALVRAVWRVLAGGAPGAAAPPPPLSVLDPACGDGGWLARALGTLELLCDACLEAMRARCNALDRSRDSHRPERLADLRRVLERVDALGAPDAQRRFARREILRRNLFGADLDPAALATCRARLLALAGGAPADHPDPPLPGLRLRLGDPGQGCGTPAELLRAANAAGLRERFPGLRAEAARLARIERLVRDAPYVQREAAALRRAEAELARRRQRVERELHWMRAIQCGVDPDDRAQLALWTSRRQPLHLWLHFHDAAAHGFDVVRTPGRR